MQNVTGGGRSGAWEKALVTALASPRVTRLMPLLVGGMALGVYLFTMAPRLIWEHAGRDGGDLITAAWVLEVPHPTGYPTYTLLAWLFTWIPCGSVAWRVHLMSGLLGAGTATLVALIGRRLDAGAGGERAQAAVGPRDRRSGLPAADLVGGQVRQYGLDE